MEEEVRWVWYMGVGHRGVVYQILRLKFPADARVREVKRLLQSVKAVRVALEQNPETRYTGD